MRLRHILIIAVALLTHLHANAGGYRTASDAQRIANRTLGIVPPNRKADTRCRQAEIRETPAYYMVTTEPNGRTAERGYAIVPKSKLLPDVLAWDAANTMSEDGSLPCHIAAWLRDYDAMATQAETCPQDVEQWIDASRLYVAEVAPLLGDMEWGQDMPYNMQCPNIEGTRAPTGCVATALAQIMRFHAWPAHGDGQLTYHTDTYNERVSWNFGATTFDWDSMRDRYDNYYWQQVDPTPVATLMAAVGAAVRMDYGPESSGSSNEIARQGMVNYLGYDPDAYLASPDAFTDAQWHQLLQEELSAGHPVFYTGRGGGSGHAFVIDGVKAGDDGTAYYHVNWGWDGLCNGYYLLNMLRPSLVGTGGEAGANYANGAAMLVGLQPDDGHTTPMRMACKSLNVAQDRIYAGCTLSICLRKLLLLGGNDFNGSLCVWLHDRDNPQQDSIAIYEEERRSITCTRGLTNYTMRCIIPPATPTGYYTVKVTCRNTDGTLIDIMNDEWPELRVWGTERWFGGNNILPAMFIGVRGIEVTAMDAEAITMFAVQMDTIVNLSESKLGGKLALALCDAKGRFLQTLNSGTMVSLRGYSTQRATTVQGSTDTTLDQGDYMLAVCFAPEGCEDWTFCYEMDYEDNIWFSRFRPLLFRINVNLHGVDIESVAVDDITTIVNDIPLHSGHRDTVAYDLQGRRLTKLPRGVPFIQGSRITIM